MVYNKTSRAGIDSIGVRFMGALDRIREAVVSAPHNPARLGEEWDPGRLEVLRAEIEAVREGRFFVRG